MVLLLFFPVKSGSIMFLSIPIKEYMNWVLALTPLRLNIQGHFIFAISDTLIH